MRCAGLVCLLALALLLVLNGVASAALFDADADADALAATETQALEWFPWGSYLCEFLLPPLVPGDVPRLIFGGLYAPGGSSAAQQHDNLTSKWLKAVFPAANFDWIDLFRYAAPRGQNALINLQALHTLARTAPFVLAKSWGQRLLARAALTATTYPDRWPVVAVLGATASAAWNLVVEAPGASLVVLLVLPLPWGVVELVEHVGSPAFQFIVFRGLIHPSHHLVSGGAPGARANFWASYRALKAVLDFATRRYFPTFDDIMGKMDAAARENHYALVVALNWLGVDHDNGWLDESMRTLRLVLWTGHVVAGLFALRAFVITNPPLFRRLLSAIPAVHLSNITFVLQLLNLAQLLGVGAAVQLFTTDSFNARVADQPNFVYWLFNLAQLLGQGAAVRLFSSDGFCARVADQPNFVYWLFYLAQLLGPQAAVKLFSHNSFAARINDELGFLQQLLNLVDVVTAPRAVTLFSSNSFCTRICSVGGLFRAAMFDLIGAFGRDSAVTLLSKNAVSSRIVDKLWFRPRLDQLFQVYTTPAQREKLVSLICILAGVMDRLNDNFFHFAIYVSEPTWTQLKSQALMRITRHTVGEIPSATWHAVYNGNA